MRPQPLADIDRDEVFTVIDAAFAQRRKTLRAALPHGLVPALVLRRF